MQKNKPICGRFIFCKHLHRTLLSCVFFSIELMLEYFFEYLAILRIQGIKRVLSRNAFTIPKKVVKSIEEYKEANNPIELFFKEIDSSEVYNKTTSSVYTKYNEFCLSNGFTAMSKIELSKQVKRRYRAEIVSKMISGKRYRIFVKDAEK